MFARLLKFCAKYLDRHYHIVLGELLYCTPGALDRYGDIPFPKEMRLLAKLLSQAEDSLGRQDHFPWSQ